MKLNEIASVKLGYPSFRIKESGNTSIQVLEMASIDVDSLFTCQTKDFKVEKETNEHLPKVEVDDIIVKTMPPYTVSVCTGEMIGKVVSSSYIHLKVDDEYKEVTHYIKWKIEKHIEKYSAQLMGTTVRRLSVNDLIDIKLDEGIDEMKKIDSLVKLLGEHTYNVKLLNEEYDKYSKAIRQKLKLKE